MVSKLQKGMDENKVWELAQILERAVTRQEHIAKLLGQERMRVVEKQDDRRERIAHAGTMASLSESVQRERFSHRPSAPLGWGITVLTLGATSFPNHKGWGQVADRNGALSGPRYFLH